VGHYHTTMWSDFLGHAFNECYDAMLGFCTVYCMTNVYGAQRMSLPFAVPDVRFNHIGMSKVG